MTMMPNDNVRRITEKWLMDNGYDGLFAPDGSCACKIGNLIPCCDSCDECEAGYYREPKPGEDCEFYIGKEKPFPSTGQESSGDNQ